MHYGGEKYVAKWGKRIWIATKICSIVFAPRPTLQKFHQDPVITFSGILHSDTQTDTQTHRPLRKHNFLGGCNKIVGSRGARALSK